MKRGICSLVGVVILTLPLTPVWASNAALTEPSSESLVSALSKIQETAARRKAVSVSFEQTRYKALVKKNVVENGTLDYAPPKNFRWEISSPFKEIYVSNNKDFWKYSQVAKHAQKLKVESAELTTLDVLFKLGNLTRDYRVEPWTSQNSLSTDPAEQAFVAPPTEKRGKLLVALFPRVKSKQKAMYVVVNESKAFVDELRIVHENGNRVRTVFGSLSEKSIPASRFEFVPPAGTAVDQ